MKKKGGDNIARPSKSHLQLIAEGKSHRTEEELNHRKHQEESLKSKQKIRLKFDRKENPIAYDEYKKLIKLMTAIDKNDAIYENIVNRYCLLYQECRWIELDLIEYQKMVFELKEAELGILDKISAINDIKSKILTFDKVLMQKREAMLRIEKENAMTIAAALRSIPKTPPKEESSGVEHLF